MIAEIKYQWHTLENKRIKLMADLSQYDNSFLNKKPSPEAWSTLQIVQHLMSAEMASLTYMKKKLSYGTDIPKAGFKSKIRLWALNLLFILPLKFKAPEILESLPEKADFESVKNQWTSQRLELQDFINKLPDNLINSEIWRHQILGKMNLSQMLDFLETHFDRHQKQIERTLKTVMILS